MYNAESMRPKENELKLELLCECRCVLTYMYVYQFVVNAPLYIWSEEVWL